MIPRDPLPGRQAGVLCTDREGEAVPIDVPFGEKGGGVGRISADLVALGLMLREDGAKAPTP